ncbi:arginine--tRNA ligase [Candidatus Avelusimicrobium fimicolum]|jgi:arginyl-tRNA synthetase|uniref:arginine--tRNA ligase n=1 Tax=Candidatus Avelusimicrobium fimicolum TaxID=3416216 RepID=UPI003D14C314
MLEKLKQDISLKLANADYFKGYELPEVEFAPAPAHTGADISLVWAMAAAKKLHKNPLEIAKEACKVLRELTGIADAQAVPPGFINLKLEDNFVITCASDRRIKDRSAETSKHNILIEFVSANPTGPLHVASGRGASLGDSLVKIHRALGYSCDSEYYVNDAGNQAELLAVSVKARKEGKEPPENGYHGTYLIDLAKRIPADLPEDQYGRWAMEELIKTQQQDMKDFHVDFTRWFRESDLHKDQAPKKALEALTAKGYTYEKDGAVWFGSTKDAEAQDDKDRVLVRHDGRPTYFLADISYHKNKYDRGYDTLIDILGADHHGYVPRMKAAVHALGHEEKTFVPIIHQLVHLIENGEQVKMSKRAGRFITLRELMDEVGTDVCRFFFASRTPNAHMMFDMDLAKKRTNENPVFYVQYVHARIHSIFKAAAEAGITDYNGITTPLAPQERALLLKLIWLKHVLRNCIADLSPHHLTTYLVELAGLFHAFYDTCRVLDENNLEQTKSRLFICQRVAERIKKGLEFIGVSAPEQM